MTAYDDIRVALQHKLVRLEKRLGKIQANLRHVSEPDSAEQAIERENDEVLEHLDDSGREEIEMIRAALGRIDAGTYIAGLIPDGATLQLGIGAIPDAVLVSLTGKRDLGIHTERLSGNFLSF